MKMLEKVLRKVCGRSNSNKAENDDKNKIKGTVVLRKKNVMDVTDLGASVIDRVHELFGKGVMLKLISAVHGDPANKNKGKLGRAAYLENWVSKITSLSAEDEAAFTVTFHLDSDSASSFGFPGAFSVRNYHHSQFYLKSLTLHDFPGHGSIHFVCNSWVYPAHRYKHDRVFFSNETYLPSETPKPLIYYREQELKVLRGTGSEKLREWDRTYDYAYYNDLGSPEKGESYRRPVLGGSEEYPYPRRGRTGRGPNKKDPETESRLFLLSLNMYVPRDEKFDQVKFSDFIAYALKSLGQVLAPEIRAAFDKTPNEFDSFEDVLRLYSDGFEISRHRAIERIRECVPLELIRELLRSDGERCLKFPMPDVIKENKTAWRTDEEFGREMLAGVNPVIIRRLEEFPPKSKLDPQIYGNQNSTITREHVEKHMHGLAVDQAIADHRLFILDHHDSLIPYLRRINSTTTTKTYASRTLLLLQDNGTLKPLAIELSLPNEDGDIYGSSSQVFTPCDDRGIGDSIWQLAKAYVSVNDSGYHQLISHWLNTHATIEPFVIASNRQLSAVHPIYKLLQPHFRDTMYINALARQILINAGGVLEVTVFPSKYAMEMSSFVYRSWDFTEQALPIDLLKRGMAVEDSNEPHGLRLVIEDYPYAVDGLEIWHAIESWVEEYCSLYYTTDDLVQLDPELQSWWKEIREVGHGDLKHEPWWPDLQTRGDLIRVCTITIWIASALHAAVNFGQYPYAGYLPNRPTVSRRLMPEPGSVEYAELERNPDLAYLKTITPQFQTLLGISLIEILSRHSTDEIYLGQREDHLNWTSDDRAREAFKRFGSKLVEIESKITERNKDKRFKNRAGPVNVPYTLLYPNTSDHSRQGGLTGKGIPNSVSI